MAFKETLAGFIKTHQKSQFNKMIDSLKVDDAVKEAMKLVDRGDFVTPFLLLLKVVRENIYGDTIVPLNGFTHGSITTSTISQPSLVADMSSRLNPENGARILEIGTASGYQAAVLSRLVGLDGEVHTIDLDEGLALEARTRLTRLGYKNVFVHSGDGLLGDPDHSPFNAMIATAGAKSIPSVWVDQLSEGGRLIAPVGPDPHNLQLTIGEKINGELRIEKIGRVFFVPFRGLREGAFDPKYMEAVFHAKLQWIEDDARRYGVDPGKLIAFMAREQNVSLTTAVNRLNLPPDFYQAIEENFKP